MNDKDTEPRMDLVNHIREQIAAGAERYANDAKLRIALTAADKAQV